MLKNHFLEIFWTKSFCSFEHGEANSSQLNPVKVRPSSIGNILEQIVVQQIWRLELFIAPIICYARNEVFRK